MRRTGQEVGEACVAKQGGVPCLCHSRTQAAQAITVSVSTRTCWNALNSASGPTSRDVKPEELSGKAADPVQSLQVPFLWVRGELCIGTHWCMEHC